MLLALPFWADAHRLDEYLQAALIEIAPQEITLQLNLTPGVDVANAVTWMLDRDSDGKVSALESMAYARALVERLSLRLDERPLALELLDARIDPIPDLKAGMGNIHIVIHARPHSLRAGNHIITFENHHRPEISVYLVNAILPRSPEIQILKQERNENQSLGRIYFSLSNSTAVNRAAGTPTLVAFLLIASALAVAVVVLRRHMVRARPIQDSVSP